MCGRNIAAPAGGCGLSLVAVCPGFRLVSDTDPLAAAATVSSHWQRGNREYKNLYMGYRPFVNRTFGIHLAINLNHKRRAQFFTTVSVKPFDTLGMRTTGMPL